MIGHENDGKKLLKHGQWVPVKGYFYHWFVTKPKQKRVVKELDALVRRRG